MKYFLVYIMLIQVACHSSGKNETSPEKAALVTNALVISPVDTLEKYSSADSLFVKGEFPFFIGNVEGNQIGLFQYSDTLTVVFQKDPVAWIATDSLECSLYFVRYQDLNGDGYKDMLITYNVTGAGGNAENVSLLFDTASTRFSHNKFYDLPNLHTVPGTGKVYSAWWGGATSAQQKEVYEQVADTLDLAERVVYTPDLTSFGSQASVRFTRFVNGKHPTISTKSGKAKDMWSVFEKSLWDSKADY